MTLAPLVYQRVSNPIALSVIESLHALLEKLENERRELLPTFGRPPGVDTLLARLRGSGLAQALAGGPGLLPEFWPDGGLLNRPLRLLDRPRSYPRLARHVAAHLQWYLEPHGREPVSTLQQVLSLLVCLGSLSIIACVAVQGSFLGLPGGVAIALAVFALLAPLGWLLGGASGWGSYDNATLRLNVQALMEYLIEAYSDNYAEDEDGVADKYGLSWG